MKPPLQAIFREFTLDDSQNFAKLSGDYNPIHVDPVGSRRLMSGQPIVHGMHLLVWALCEHGKAKKLHTIDSLSVTFIKQVPIGSKVECQWSDSGNCSRIELFIKREIVSQIDIEWNSEHFSFPLPLDAAPPVRNPVTINVDKIFKTSGSLELYLPLELLDSVLPGLKQQIPHSQIASLLGLTRLIGMHCPGLNSLFAGFKLKLSDIGKSIALNFSVSSFDDRFSSVELKFECPGWKGSVDAYLRPAPVKQASYTETAMNVLSNEFKGLKAVIIGGSRGLGEVFAKLLCAGGADVTITYFQGNMDAENVVREISFAGGSIEALEFDINKSINFFVSKPDLLVYCSTPSIFRESKGKFSSELFNTFNEHYVHGFNRICSHFAEKSQLKVIYPSSVVLDELSVHLGEYAASKAAGELLCLHLEKYYRGLVIHKPRLPRLATDQTSSIFPVYNEAPPAILLREIRLALNL